MLQLVLRPQADINTSPFSWKEKTVEDKHKYLFWMGFCVRYWGMHITCISSQQRACEVSLWEDMVDCWLRSIKSKNLYSFMLRSQDSSPGLTPRLVCLLCSIPAVYATPWSINSLVHLPFYMFEYLATQILISGSLWEHHSVAIGTDGL